jgi:hypothetical protein
MAVGKASKSQEAYYSKYKTLYPENRKRKLQRVLKAQPDNEQVKMALKDIHYRRKTPNSAVWSSSSRRMAQMLRDWTGYLIWLSLTPIQKCPAMPCKSFLAEHQQLSLTTRCKQSICFRLKHALKCSASSRFQQLLS